MTDPSNTYYKIQIEINMKTKGIPFSPLSKGRTNPIHKFYDQQNKKHIKQMKQAYLDRFKTRSVYGQYEKVARRNEQENNPNNHSHDNKINTFNSDKRSRGVHINMKLIKSCNVNNSIIAQLNCRSDQRKLLNKNHSNAYYSSNNSPREQDNNRHYQKQNCRDLFCITQTQLVGFRENAKYTRPKFIKKLSQNPTVENRFNEIIPAGIDPTLEFTKIISPKASVNAVASQRSSTMKNWNSNSILFKNNRLMSANCREDLDTLRKQK